MTKDDIKLAKEKILKCLTEDFEYGLDERTRTPLKRRRKNVAIFNKTQGFACYHDTDLEMVMEKVMRGLYFAMADSQGDSNES